MVHGNEVSLISTQEAVWQNRLQEVILSVRKLGYGSRKIGTWCSRICHTVA